VDRQEVYVVTISETKKGSCTRSFSVQYGSIACEYAIRTALTALTAPRACQTLTRLALVPIGSLGNSRLG